MQTTLKLSDEVLKRLGATAGDAEAKILALLGQLEAVGKLAATAGQPNFLKEVADGKSNESFAALAQAVAGLPAIVQGITAKLESFEARIKAVEDRKVSLAADERATIVTEATTAARDVAAKEVSAAIAKVGVQSVTAGGKADDKADDKAGTPVGADYAAHYKASAALQEEFSSAETYAAFKKAEARGAVRISGRKDFDSKNN